MVRSNPVSRTYRESRSPQKARASRQSASTPVNPIGPVAALSKETIRYTQKAERAVMARGGMEKLGRGRLGNKSVPLGNGSPKSGTIRPKK